MRGLIYILILAWALAGYFDLTYSNLVNYIQDSNSNSIIEYSYCVGLYDNNGTRIYKNVVVHLEYTLLPYNNILWQISFVTYSPGQLCWWNYFNYIGKYQVLISSEGFSPGFAFVNITQGSIAVNNISVVTDSNPITVNVPFFVSVTVFDSKFHKLFSDSFTIYDYSCVITLKDSLGESIMSQSSLTTNGKCSMSLMIWYTTFGNKTIEATCYGVTGKLNVFVKGDLLDIEFSSKVNLI